MFDWLTGKKKPSASPEQQDEYEKVSTHSEAAEAASSSSGEHDSKRMNEDHNQLQKYLADAVRNTKHPDRLWEYRDPMARKPGQVLTKDPTNTGA
ncbi:hypothetical protein BCR43DRAFT_493206 [Syncephalastrum racemosum]|uniref:Uncharacterized protein n=1 Tax=Syncephalastrum racemosum TaxID=13706 RepID=A0A1X2HA71_SYNRA|nr:hypothetical protein BCR43DRAFT_493206 [Syncephalastrum racemosum]